MDVGQLVSEAVQKMLDSNPEGALFAICAALEATARAEFGGRGRAIYKRFIQENMGLITDIAFGGKRILNLSLGYRHPEIETSPDGACSIEDILYHAVRCGLYHEAKLPDNLRFTDELVIKAEDGALVLPSALINGLIVAVVVSPANKDRSAQKPHMLNIGAFPIPFSRLWGRREELLWLLEASSEAARTQGGAAQAPAGSQGLPNGGAAERQYAAPPPPAG